MDLEADLKWIHQELDNVKDPTFIEAIKNMLKYRKKVSLERIGLDQYNEEINAPLRKVSRLSGTQLIKQRQSIYFSSKT